MGRKCTSRLPIQLHAPSTGFDIVSASRFCTAALSVTGASKLTLMVRPGAILSRADLEDRIYGWNEEVESNVVEFLIHALRKKLSADAIKNVRGVGWMVSREK